MKGSERNGGRAMSTRLFRFIVIALTALAVLAPLSLSSIRASSISPLPAGRQLGLDAYEFVLSEEDSGPPSSPRSRSPPA